MGDARAVERQLQQPWPPPDSRGFVTRTGRLFHRDEACPGYQRGVQESERRGRQLAPLEWTNAYIAQRRGKGACSRCWQ